MSGRPVTVSSLCTDYALYGVTLGMIRSLAANIAVNNAAHLGGDHDPLPPAVDTSSSTTWQQTSRPRSLPGRRPTPPKCGATARSSREL